MKIREEIEKAHHEPPGEDKLRQKKILEEQVRRMENLPHLYGQKFYVWQREYWDSRNRNNFLCSANQIGKSSINIKKCIHWATEKTLWPKLWATRPRTFFYLYPSGDLATIEFEEKWVPEFLPRNEMRDDTYYGWRPKYDKKGHIHSIHFASGVSIYFKYYSVRRTNQQAGTVWAIFGDEEIPVDLYDEYKFRLVATNGYFHSVFTPTLGQPFWKAVIEGKGKFERLTRAFKKQISMFDCMYFEDGSPSHWTKERIQEVVEDCKSEVEVQRRVWGRFVSEVGMKYASFRESTNTCDPRPVPESFWKYSGVDIGSGGKDGHPAAIVFVAVNADYTHGDVFLMWRGEDEVTTAGDIMSKYLEMKNPFKNKVLDQRYDHQSRDFKTLSERIGEPFNPANKKHDEGEGTLNALFRYEALTIHLTEAGWKLVYELLSVKKDFDKRLNKGDDLVDALRYACATIPWDWSRIKIPDPKVKQKEPTMDDLRRARMKPAWRQKFEDELNEEITEWNELMEG